MNNEWTTPREYRIIQRQLMHSKNKIKKDNTTENERTNDWGELMEEGRKERERERERERRWWCAVRTVPCPSQ